eukprot:SAG31_NODE_231_length_19768_cov_9.498170_3_plen_506_part_00
MERQARRPLLLEDTPVDKWPADDWSVQSVAAKIDEFRNVYSHSNSVFLHYTATAEPGEPGGLPPVGWAPPHGLVNCSTRCFLHGVAAQRQDQVPHGCGSCQGQANGDYLYWSSPIGPPESSEINHTYDVQHSGAAGAAALWPTLEKPMWELTKSPSVESHSEITANLWIAGPGVTAAAHYDSFHNILVQMQGTKKVILLPPSAAAALGTYPRTHPSHRQARFDLTVPLDERSIAHSTFQQEFPRLQQVLQNGRKSRGLLGAMVATIQPGDVLYIPPFWFHLVIVSTDLPSVSLNFWYDAAELAAATVAESLPLPFESSWRGAQRRSAVAVYSRLYMIAICGGRQPESCASTNLQLLHSSRWAEDVIEDPASTIRAANIRIMSESGRPDDNAPGAEVAAEQCELLPELSQCQEATSKQQELRCSVHDLGLDEQQGTAFISKVEAAAAALKNVENPDAAHGASVSTLLAWGRLEQLAEWAVQDLISVGVPPATAIGELLLQIANECR